jgi:hypothetical protein
MGAGRGPRDPGTSRLDGDCGGGEFQKSAQNLFETDFPHPSSLYGDEVQARIRGGLSDCDESVRRKILWDNAQRLYKVTGPSAADEAKRAAAVGA